jgi:hypothetical protein
LKINSILKEHMASIFGVEEWAEQVTNVKACGKQMSPTLKIKAVCSFKTSVEFQRNAERYIPEDSTLYTVM